jgi:protein O-GlcNAc transferase
MAVSGYVGWLQRGREHQRGRRPVDAMLCFQRAAALEPHAVDPRYLLGEVQWQLGAIPAAVAAWRDAARLSPRHLGSQLALAEASLAVADVDRAADAAAAALAIAPEDRAARVLYAVAALASGRDRAALTGLAPVLASDASRLVSPVTGGTLARELAVEPALGGAREVLDAILPHRDRVAFALLAPLARAAQAADAPAPLRAARDEIARVALERPVAHGELDVLREIALAFHHAGDLPHAMRLATRYAEACIAFAPRAAPLRWPLRTSGAQLRVAVLMPNGDAAATRALTLLRDTAERAAHVAWTLLVEAQTPSVSLGGSVIRVIGASPDATIAAGVAAADPDLLIDMAGLASATGPLLAMRPAASAIAVDVAGPPQAAPLIGGVIPAKRDAFAAMLENERNRALARAHSASSAEALNEGFASAVQAHHSGDAVRARAAYERLLAAQPDHAPTLHLLAAVHREQRDFDAASALLARALEHAPEFTDARAAAARIARDRGEVEQGIALVDAGLEHKPHSEALWRVRGELELARHDGVAAEAAFAQALAHNPIDAEANYNFGVALQKQGRLNEAARAYQRALAFDPGFPDAHFNLAVVFQEAGHPAAAIPAYRAVLERDPRRVAAYRNVGEALLAAGRIDEWLANFRRFEAQCPEALPLAVQALEACQYAADAPALDRYLEGLRRERFRAGDPAQLTDSLEQLLYLLLFFDVEPEMLFRFAQTYTSTAPQVYGPPLPRAASRKPGRIRVGYLSADLRNHVMGKMMWEALRHHDRERFEVHLYSTSTVRDGWTDRYASIADRFDVIAGSSERDAALRIAADDLDLLIDLSGHTKGGKPGILARKPARVQITHIASAGSVGLRTVDFKLTDAYADVPDNQQWMIETLLPMQGCVYPYRRIEPATGHPFHRATLGIPEDAVVIGAFVTPMKLSRRCLSLWREVLERLPRASLAFSPTHPALRPVFERLCAAAGIARNRLLFLPQGRDDAENQARYAVIDFVLDPMPFGGVNGVLEPLDAGVPVVTLVGRRHGERSAYSILSNLGVTHTVAQGGRDYVDIAARLAQDPGFMRDVRQSIRAGLRSSTLVDMPAHTRNLEAAYVEALRQKAPDVLEDGQA